MSNKLQGSGILTWFLAGLNSSFRLFLQANLVLNLCEEWIIARSNEMMIHVEGSIVVISDGDLAVTVDLHCQDQHGRRHK